MSGIWREGRRNHRFVNHGPRQLSATDVVDALADAGIVEPWSPTDDGALSDTDVRSILRLLSHLDDRGKAILSEARADSVAIVPCIDGSFASRLDEDDRALFELLAPDLKILDETRLASQFPPTYRVRLE